jgi:hypothetical protein
MEEFECSENLTKSYLLGEMGEADREQFEERFFLDPEFNEVARLVEDELIEDYAAGALAADAHEKFIRHYLTTPHQLRKLELTKALKEYSDRHPSTHPGLTPDPPPETFTARLLRQWRARRFFRVAAYTGAAGGLCVLLVAGVLLWQYVSRAVLLQKLRDLNAANASAQISSAHTFAVTLSPGRSRGGGGPAPEEVVVPPNKSVVRLTLTPVPDGYDILDVEVKALDGGRAFTIPSVRPEGERGARRVLVNVPTELLGPGDYLLKLLRVDDASGQAREVADYFLRISGA